MCMVGMVVCVLCCGEQNYSNWRGDSEKRFKFDKEFFTSTAAWGLLPFGLCYFLASNERVRTVNTVCHSCCGDGGGVKH